MVHSKKWLIVGLAAFLTACLADNIHDTGPDVAIGFAASVYEEPQTRGVVKEDHLESGSFGVYAFLDTTPNTPYSELSNKAVPYTGVQLAPAVNWPGTLTLKFHTYYPHSGNYSAYIEPTFTNASGGTIKFKTPTAAHIDLMYAAGSGSRDEVYAGVSGKVKLEMDHLLSWLSIQAKTADNTNSGKIITITDVTLTALTEGTYTVTSVEGAGSWGTPTARGALTASLIDGGVVGTTSAPVADFMIVPQDLNVAANSLIVSYKLSGESGSRSFTVDGTDLPAMTAAGSQGKKNVLDITFNIREGDVDVTFETAAVLPWEKGIEKDAAFGKYTLTVSRTEYKFSTTSSTSADRDAANLLTIKTTHTNGWKAAFYSNEACTGTPVTTNFKLVDEDGADIVSGSTGSTKTYIVRKTSGAKTGYLKVTAGGLDVIIKIAQAV